VSRLRRRVLNLATAISALLFCAFVILWFRSLRTADELYLPGKGQTLYHLHSGAGLIELRRFSNWPDSPRRLHLTHPPDPLHQITPVFTRQRGGTYRKQVRFFQFAFTRGTTRVALNRTGSVDFGSSALPIFQTFPTQPLSPPMPFWAAVAPIWFPVLLSALLPGLVALRAARPHLRSRTGPKEPIDYWG
jgi:hypothetical protein